ncbi:Transient receptor potential (TRP) ion channel domain containing protein [Elaphomyces granulatus]
MRSLSLLFLFATFFDQFPRTSAVRMLESSSLNTCQADSSITAALFNVVYTPDNNTLTYDISANSSVTGTFTVQLQVIAYGYTAMNKSIDPCQSILSSNFCPIQQTGPLVLQSAITLPTDLSSKIPNIAFTVPDLDGIVRINIISSTGKSVACVEAELSNGQTVYQNGVGWATATIVGLALTASAIASGSGYSKTAAHVAADALSLFGFFQAQAMIGMTAIPMPPIVESWTQNFQWTMGIIPVGFMQSICTWYQRSTGGTPSGILSTLSTASVEVQKRSIRFANYVLSHLSKRDDSSDTWSTSSTIIMGIKRVGFRANIEETNIFMTGLIWFVSFILLITMVVLLFRGFCKIAVKYGWMQNYIFRDFRNGWTNVMRGILFRVLIGFPQMCVLCLWELTERDSVAEVILAILVFLSMTGILGWSAWKVIQLARRSQRMHKTPSYILYSNPEVLHTWGFLYVQYRAPAYFAVVPALIYIFVKAAFIGLGQYSDVLQAVALLVIEIAALLAASIIRPWMDKKTDTLNIAILSVHTLNAIFLLMFTSVFGQPPIINGVMGVIFFAYNALFAAVLLILLLIGSGYAILSKNPEVRYEMTRDDRGSFIKSHTCLNSELDGLAATARGDIKSEL